jgi:alpha-L-rhamnosidase
VTYLSINGLIATHWSRKGDRFQLTVTIPANTSARVVLPTVDAAGVTEGGLPIDRVEGVRLSGTEAGEAVYEVESGTYSFSSPI